MKNRAARGVSEGENNKGPCTSSKFHFSKGKYGNIVLAWHGVLIRKAKANFRDICAEAQKIYGVTDGGNQPAQAQVDLEIRTRVSLDSESEGDDDSSNEGLENYQNSDRDVDYRTQAGSSIGDNDDVDDGGHLEYDVHNPEHNNHQEVYNHAGLSRLGGHSGTK